MSTGLQVKKRFSRCSSQSTPYHPWDWYIYLHLVDFYGKCIGKYSSPMDPMGYQWSLKNLCMTNLPLEWHIFYQPTFYIYHKINHGSCVGNIYRSSHGSVMRISGCFWLIGGRWYIITQFAIYKWYTSDIYIYIYSQLGDSMLPTYLPTSHLFFRNQKQPCFTNLRMFKELFYKQQWVAVAASPAWSFFVEENRTEAVRLFHLLSLGVRKLREKKLSLLVSKWTMTWRCLVYLMKMVIFQPVMLVLLGVHVVLP